MTELTAPHRPSGSYGGVRPDCDGGQHDNFTETIEGGSFANVGTLPTFAPNKTLHTTAVTSTFFVHGYDSYTVKNRAGGVGGV